MSIPPTFLVLMPLLGIINFWTLKKMGGVWGGTSPISWKNAIFKLNLQNLVHIFRQHFTENPLFFSNEILAIIMSIPSTFPFFFYDFGYYHVYSYNVSCFNAFAFSKYDFWGVMIPFPRKTFAIWDLNMLNFRPYFSLNVCVNYIILGLYTPLPKKILHLLS